MMRYRQLCFVLAFIAALHGCGNLEPMPEPGQNGVLRLDGASVPVAVSRQDAERVLTLFHAGDGEGLGELRRAGKMFYVPSETRIRVITMGTIYEVRLLDGEHSGKSGFVPSLLVRRE